MKQQEPKDQGHTSETPEYPPPPSPTAGLRDPSALPQDHAAPPAPETPELGVQRGSEESTERLLAAYQETFDVLEDLPAVVWVRWSGKGPGRFLKVPYLRWFLQYFLGHHVHKSLSTLNRRLHAIAALAGDPDVNKADREAVKLYLQSLPPPPYRRLAFAIFFVALLLALPLRNFGDVTQVLDIIGAVLRFDVSLVARAFQAKEFLNTVRALLVLLLASSVVASLLASPFVLKRMLFNLYPASKERLGSTTAREHALSDEGLYALEDRVFREVGLRRPNELRLDLIFWVFVLILLLFLSVCLGLLTLAAAGILDVTLDVRVEEIPWNVNVELPADPWVFALPTIIFIIAFVVRLKRLLNAWQRRNLPKDD
jgi:hypothetical protein